MTRVAALVRVSTQRQARKHRDDEETLPVQREAIRRFAASHGWKITKEYAEEGVSAWSNSSADREILQTVLADAKLGEFDVLAIFKYDRLSRVSLEYPTLLSLLYRLGVRVWSVADDGTGRELTIETQMDKLLRFVEGWQAEAESVNTSLRVKAKMRQMAERGVWTGGRAPFGFRVRDGGKQPNGDRLSLEINDAEAAVVREVFRLYLDEEIGSVTIAARLNEQGARRRNGGLWHDTDVRELLKNPAVAGRPAYGRHVRDRRTRRMRQRTASDPEVILAPEVISEYAIVPWEDFERAQERMAAWANRPRLPLEDRTRRTRAETGPLLLTGIIRCGHCGGPITTGWARPPKVLKDGTRVVYTYPRYVDRNRYGGLPCDGQRGYSVKRIDGAVLDAVQDVMDHIDENDLYLRLRDRVVQGVFAKGQRLEMAKKRQERAKRLFDQWASRLNTFLVKPEASLYSESFIADQIRDAETKLAETEMEVHSLKRDGADIEARLNDLDHFRKVAGGFWKQFLESDRLGQKRLLRSLLEAVIVKRDSIELRWRVNLGEIMGETDLGTLEWRDRREWGKTGEIGPV